MSDISLRALVIREVDFAEHDRYLHVLTDTGQRLEIVCRGLRRKNATYAGALRLFCYADIKVRTGTADKLVLRSAELRTSFWRVTQSMEQYALCCYLVELVTTLTDATEKNPDLSRLLLYALHAMSDQHRPLPLVKATFELRCMAQAGYYPSVDVCDICACDTPDSLCFSVEQGVVRCQNCVQSRDQAGFFRLSDGCRAAMQHILVQDIPKVFGFTLGAQTLAQLAYVCERYVQYHTGRTYSTLTFYRSLEGTFAE